jgi:predicted nucleic acid-binding protein
LTRSAARADLPLFYADSSALVKLIADEPESRALRRFVRDADLVTCDLVITELPRAIRRAVARNPKLPGDVLLRRIDDLLDSIGLLPLDRGLLLAAGALAEPALRSLDAIHVAAAISVFPHDGVVSYDERQSAAARLAGIRTYAPGG